MPRFLPFLVGIDFLVVYVFFTVATIFIFSILIRSEKKEDFIVKDLSDEEYYVLTNGFSRRGIFYYMTYRLYAKGYLKRLESKEGLIWNEEKEGECLIEIERFVYSFYKLPEIPSNIKENIIKEDLFREWYENISLNLREEGMFREVKEKRRGRLIFTATLMVFIAGFLRLLGGVSNGMAVGSLIKVMVILLIATPLILLMVSGSRLSEKGRASADAYRLRMREANKTLKEEDNFENNYDYDGMMYNFLFTSAWMGMYGIHNDTEGTSSFYLNHDTSYDSSSSNDSNDSGGSCSSCSSCSSCGGCGGSSD